MHTDNRQVGRGMCWGVAEGKCEHSLTLIKREPGLVFTLQQQYYVQYITILTYQGGISLFIGEDIV